MQTVSAAPERRLFFGGTMKLKEFEYGEDDLVYDVAPSREPKPTRFDELLQSKWNEAMANGHFWYKLEKLETRILPGKYGFVAQLNTKRAQERRKPQHVSSICMPFDGSIFNFTKLKEGEMLFSLKNVNKEQDSAKEVGHWVVINVSPVEYCNSLLVPSLYNCLPQILTPVSLRLAIDMVLLSGSPNFRLGFNSLGGHASVNHHHFHLYYLEHRLYIETARVNHLWSECYEIVDYPAKGFVFQVTKDNKETVIQELMILVQMLLNTSTAHNLFVTRGTSFKSDNIDGVEQPVVRVFLWARHSCYGAKDESAFNVALCELSGHLIMKNNEGYLAATEDSVSQELRNFCDDTFAEVRSQVVAMNRNCNSSLHASPSNS
ncbi:GDP-D-glucose phosphorylase 1 isoform X2 [Dermacentor albipictus]|uniref:GDP-D-glucose phosphorylase 1 isoform X2 n=1 Tax=Dermacentor albipictus TaxID=60249 RepID=UPI0031FC9342